MQTLEQIIEDVVFDLDRPDLVQQCRNKLRNLIVECHAISDFHRDVILSEATTVTNPKVTISLPADFRKLSNIVALDDNDSIINIDYCLKSIKPYTDYYGFIDTTNTYYLAGGAININHELGVVPPKIALQYYARPTFTVADDGTVSTTSWMLDSYGGLLKNKLIKDLAAKIGNTTAYNEANSQIQEQTLQLLVNEVNTLPMA